MRRATTFCLLLFLASCAISPQVPAWRTAAARNLESFQEQRLAGNHVRAAAAFRTAVEELQKGGDLNALQCAYLTASAMQVALLEQPDAAAYIRCEAVEFFPANANYLAFLQGDEAVDVELLPVQYRELLRAFRQGRGELADIVARIDDPRSRLIATGWLIQRGREDERLLLLAADTAAASGWKETLLVYLGRLRTFYERNQAPDKARTVAARIRVLTFKITSR